MIVIWITLLVLHQGYSLVPVLTVQFGEPVTITCVLSDEDFSSRDIYWYKQRAGDTLKSIVTLAKKTSAEYGPEFSERLEVKTENYFSNLTILRTITEDEGMYHCGITEWIKTKWSGTYLLVKGNSERTSNYTVVQTVSDPVRPGDSVTLQCSVLSDSDNKTCPGDHSVYWFRAGSDQSHPNIIYTGGNNECEKRSDSVKSCVHHFSKIVSSSDVGTYYCAVATCGQILFGNGTNLQIGGTMCSQMTGTIIFLFCAFLALTVLICTIEKSKCDCCNDPAAVVLQQNCQKTQQREEDMRIYSAVIFSMMKTGGRIKDTKAAERARIYAAVKAFGLD
ncbi:uncharacterized protein LOC113160104 [Anabas testudineus]|uniref:Ig-like domain-containing protein n=1 Tax=Anabas testudineus TaxID=64144 RepID=A0A7N6C5U3_ANATE|nr:uncharacterized protein LOC113160104 [Anabas testudineus]